MHGQFQKITIVAKVFILFEIYSSFHKALVCTTNFKYAVIYIFIVKFIG